jgi:hypothetical protein
MPVSITNAALYREQCFLPLCLSTVVRYLISTNFRGVEKFGYCQHNLTHRQLVFLYNQPKGQSHATHPLRDFVSKWKRAGLACANKECGTYVEPHG